MAVLNYIKKLPLNFRIPRTWGELHCGRKKLYFSQSHEDKPNLYLI